MTLDVVSQLNSDSHDIGCCFSVELRQSSVTFDVIFFQHNAGNLSLVHHFKKMIRSDWVSE